MRDPGMSARTSNSMHVFEDIDEMRTTLKAG